MGLADWNIQVISQPHGGKGSGCCPWCDPDLVVIVTFWDGSKVYARRFKKSPLGKGFARMSTKPIGGKRWNQGILTPRDKVSRI